jgi:transcriptional regulator with XRE-family HTH domain
MAAKVRQRRLRQASESAAISELGARLDQERRRQGLSIAKLSALSRVSEQCTLSAIHGRHDPRLTTTLRLFAALGRRVRISFDAEPPTDGGHAGEVR